MILVSPSCRKGSTGSCRPPQPFKREESVVSYQNKKSFQNVPLVSSGHGFGFPAPISKRKPPPERRALHLPPRVFLIAMKPTVVLREGRNCVRPLKNFPRSDLLNVLVPGRGYTLADRRDFTLIHDNLVPMSTIGQSH